MRTDAEFLALAIDLATANVADGGGPFGAVVVKDGEVVGRGVNRVTASLDPTAHGEVVAMRDACLRIRDFTLAGATLFTSCEPCPMCLSAALWARVDRVLYAADRHDAADAGFDDAAFHGLFRHDTSGWPLAIEHLALPQRLAPFDAWRANEERIPY